MNTLTNRRRAILAVIAALMIAALACGSPTPAPADTAASNPDPPATERPTERPTSTPDDSVAESEYAEDMMVLLERYYQDSNSLATMFGAMGDNPILILDDGWTSEVYDHLDSLRTTNRRVRAIDPPARLADAHADMVEASHLIDCAADRYERGIREIDADLITRGTDCLSEGIDFMESANRKLEALD